MSKATQNFPQDPDDFWKFSDDKTEYIESEQTEIEEDDDMLPSDNYNNEFYDIETYWNLFSKEL